MYVELSHGHISAMWTCIAVLEYIHAHVHFMWAFVAVFEVSMKSFVYVYMNYGHFYFYNQNLSV